MKKIQTYPKTFHFILLAWGDEQINQFLDFCLPNLLTDGNLKAFATKTNSTFKLYTKSTDVARIRGHRFFRELTDLMRVEIIEDFGIYLPSHPEINQHPDLLPPIAKCHRMAVDTALQKNAALILLDPDILMAEGSLIYLHNLALDGKRIVGTPQLQVIKERFIPVFEERFRNTTGYMPAQARDLTKVAMQHLHQSTRDFFIDSELFPTIPHSIFWPVGKNGLLGRCVGFHPMMVYLADKKSVLPVCQIDADYCTNSVPNLDDYHIATDSDEIIVCKLRPEHQAQELSSRGRFNSLLYADRLQRHLYPSKTVEQIRRRTFLEKIKIHSAEISEAWEDVEKKSDKVVHRILAIAGLIGKYGDIDKPVSMSSVIRNVIFGTGVAGQSVAAFLRREGMEVAYFVDNDSKRWNSSIMGCQVKSLVALESHDFDMIIVASVAGKQKIFRQLNSMGFTYRKDFIYFLDVFQYRYSWGVKFNVKLEIPQLPDCLYSMTAQISFGSKSMIKCELLELSSVQCVVRVPVSSGIPIHIYSQTLLAVSYWKKKGSEDFIDLEGNVSKLDRDTQSASSSKFAIVSITFAELNVDTEKRLALLLSDIG